jgi:hypothetical protein
MLVYSSCSSALAIALNSKLSTNSYEKLCSAYRDRIVSNHDNKCPFRLSTEQLHYLENVGEEETGKDEDEENKNIDTSTTTTTENKGSFSCWIPFLPKYPAVPLWIRLSFLWTLFLLSVRLNNQKARTFANRVVLHLIVEDRIGFYYYYI